MDVNNACTDSVSSVLVTRQVAERDTALGDTHSREAINDRLLMTVVNQHNGCANLVYQTLRSLPISANCTGLLPLLDVVLKQGYHCG
ncbi:Chromosome transmission fidelity protein 8 [Fusarium oxysporum f. sp. albedinis]|nr:Chromosome transmission fidelity protein 8 [Fusarium oxysporum f. sp. albedinis]